MVGKTISHHRIVALVCYTRLNHSEAAQSLKAPPRTVSREWPLARNWLRDEVCRGIII